VATEEIRLKKPKILGIYRNPQFSNNAIEVDRLILEESITQLQKQSSQPLAVEMMEEAEVAQAGGEYSLVLTMAQGEQSLAALDRNLPSSPIWNSPAAIRNCYRKAMSRILMSLPVGYVPYQLAATASGSPKIVAGESYWLKRSDFHAIADEDVTLAENEAEVRSKLERFRGRGVSEVIIQRHIHGDIYKFYGVRGKFFRAIKVRDFLKSSAVPDLRQLEANSFLAAESLGLMVFGGDAILDAAGKFHFIDLNDWPSFRICRDDAAKAVGALASEWLAASTEARREPAVSTVHA
jgi:hypothetical protein